MVWRTAASAQRRPPRAIGLYRLPGAGDAAAHQHHKYGGHAGNRRPMPPGELPQLIPRAGRPRRDRLVRQIAPDIRR